MATTTGLLTADHPKILAFLTGWHEDGRETFKRFAPNLDYDSDAYAKSAHERRKYLALDRGRDKWRSGAYLVDRVTEEVYTIKAYGVPNRRLGTLDEVLAARSWDRR